MPPMLSTRRGLRAHSDWTQGSAGAPKGPSFIPEPQVIRSRKDLVTIWASHIPIYFFKMEKSRAARTSDTAQHPSSSLSQPGPSTSFLTAQGGLMKAPIQEVEGRLQDVHVRGAAFPTQLAHCKR